MGIWGIHIFENDIACDVKENYERYFVELGDAQAYLKICKENMDLIGTEDEPFFWYALALSQWENGRLNHEAKHKALEFIAKNGGISHFEDKRSWKRVLHGLQLTLSETMPPRKTIDKPTSFSQNPWNIGDIYAYKLHNKISKKRGLTNKYVVLQKVGDIEYYKNVFYSVIQVFDGVFDCIPDICEIDNLRILPLIDPPGVDGTPNSLSEYVPSFEHYLKATMILDRQEDYPQEHLVFIGNSEIANTEIEEFSFSDLFWSKNNMDDWITQFYIAWRNQVY